MPVEAYLEQFRPAGVDAADLLDLVYNEVVLREEDGESPQLDEYLDRFPGHDEALRAQFDVHQLLRTSGSFSRRTLLGRTSLLGSARAVGLPLTATTDAARSDEPKDSRRKLKVIVTGGHEHDITPAPKKLIY